MKILAFDTATEGCSAALFVDGETVERFEIAPRAHARLLVPWIQEMLAAAELRPQQLDGLAVSAGPGSFTGIRIGFSVAQGIAAAAGLGLLPIPTLEALALEGRHSRPRVDRILAALDARMGEIYVAGYQFEEGELPVIEFAPVVCAPEALGVGREGGWHGVGSAFAAYPESLAGLIEGEPEPTLLPRARSVAVLAAAALESGIQPVAPERAEPIYLRNQVARKAANP